jgi:anti-sigma B factor antagonist
MPLASGRRRNSTRFGIVKTTKDTEGDTMEMHTYKIDDILVVQPLAKRIDAASATDFKGTMVDYINQGNLSIILDLANVDFVDSTGLGMIVAILKTLGKDGIMSLCGLSDIVTSLFTLTRMHRIFDIAPSVEESVVMVRRRTPHG